MKATPTIYIYTSQSVPHEFTIAIIHIFIRLRASVSILMTTAAVTPCMQQYHLPACRLLGVTTYATIASFIFATLNSLQTVNGLMIAIVTVRNEEVAKMKARYCGSICCYP